MASLQSGLFQLVPLEDFSLQQKAFRSKTYGGNWPMYRLLREPTQLEEFDWVKYGKISIWRDNGSLICVGENAAKQYHEQHVFSSFIKYAIATLIAPFSVKIAQLLPRPLPFAGH